MNLHIFNPETEYALASGKAAYTPPKRVVEISRKFALLPALYAQPDDYILIREKKSDYVSLSKTLDEICQIKKLNLCFIDDLRYISSEKFNIIPWGWNHELKKWLYDRGFNNYDLPAYSYICNLRQLAHRRTTASFHDLAVKSGFSNEFIPKEIDSVEEAFEFYSNFKEVFFKAPWSSSGRGILHSKELTGAQIEQWLRGIIRDQGSVMGEKAFDRILDFGAEWTYENGNAIFHGFSAFEVSSRGKYKYNYLVTHNEFIDNILPDAYRKLSIRYDKEKLTKIIHMQKKILETLVKESYNGPIGIDMFLTVTGEINPCVEINFRNTMGKIALDLSNEYKNHSESSFSKIISAAFPSGKMDLNSL